MKEVIASCGETGNKNNKSGDSSMSNSNLLFSNSGVLNASSVQDALQSIVKLAALLESNSPSNAGLTAPSVSDSSRDDLISRAIQTQEGKIALAQAMANPIRRNLDYHGIARRSLVVDPLPQGALP